jgi:WD40 repeat protein
MTYTPKGDSLITASKDETILVWAHPARIKDGYKLTSRLKGHNAPALGVCVHPTGLLMATCSCDQTAVLWSVPDEGKMGEARDQDWQSVSTILGHGDYVKGVSFRDDGRMLATASRDKTVRLWATPARPRGAHARALFCLDRSVPRGWSIVLECKVVPSIRNFVRC